MWNTLVGICLLFPGADPRDNLFETRVRPVLVSQCQSCHGPEKQKGGLRLDSAEAFARGGETGPLVDRDHPEKSLLLKSLSHTDDLKMPPKGKLPSKDIQAIEAWVRSGAQWPKGLASAPGTSNPGTPKANSPAQKVLPWWAKTPFDPVPKSPKGQTQASVHPIDSFLGVKRARLGLAQAPPADRRTLLRRMTFDLTGLPPTPEQIREFEADKSPDAVSRQIDRLLASPAYGEKWARKWLDIARYADSNGMDENLSHALAWKYRDWVIKAIQNDLPYDQFVASQLAGDLIGAQKGGEQAKDGLIATGFLSIGPKMLAEDDPVKMRMDIIDEQVDTLGQAFLGLTLGCARCHDHKYDPISAKEYYGLAGIFYGTDTMETYSVVARWMERPLLSPDEEKAHLAQKKTLDEEKKTVMAQKAARRKTEIDKQKTRGNAYIQAAKEFIEQQSTQPKEPPKEARVIEAEDFVTGNLLKDKATYGAGIGVLVNKGELPNRAEYAPIATSLPAGIQSGWVRIWIRHAAEASRPIKLFANGKLLTESAASQVTGSWRPEGQRWFVAAVTKVESGKLTLQLECPGPVPHIDKFAIEFLSREVAQAQTLGAWAEAKGLHAVVLARYVETLKKVAGKSPEEQAVATRDAAKGPLRDDPSLDVLIPAGELDAINQKIAKIDKRLAELNAVPQVMAVREGKPTDLRVHIRGSHLSMGEDAPRGFPGVLALGSKSPLPKDQSGRLQLAKWITQPNHPLTARVMANRIWQGHFGQGIVRSVDNFGNLGELPSDPELLDWLAAKFVQSGWSIKAMHRLIMSSAAYQQSTKHDEESFRKDPDNRTLWHFDRRRLDAEEFRDAMLQVAGTLELQAGGSLLTIPDRQYVTSTASFAYDSHNAPRRSVYLPVVRSALFEFFQVYDFADPSALKGERTATVIPTQALFLLNGKLLDEAAKSLANRIRPKGKEKNAKPSREAEKGSVEKIYALTLGRAPNGMEVEEIMKFLESHPGDPWHGLARALLSSNEFLYLD